jgi:hypothetical protein
MKREANRSMPLLLYVLAAPVYFVRGVLTLLRLFRLWRIARLGYVDCPHCGAENAIDVLGYCPKCRTSEYGNRLRCTGCGTFSAAFPCDACGVTIHCL